jgi:hypothetical protein
MRTKLAAALAIGAMLTIAGCSCSGEISFGDKTIDSEEAAQEISDGLADAYGVAPKSMTCPDGVEVAEGETFVCTGVSPDSDGARPFEVEVKMTDDKGGIRYRTQVTYTDTSQGQT